jgi:hypothetical protein
MRSVMVCVVASLGCGSGTNSRADANTVADSAPDAAPDAAIDAPGCQPTVLLTGGTDVVAQGWTIIMVAPAQVTYVQDYTHLQTSTNTGAQTSGLLLLSYPGAIDVGKPFKLQVVMLVESVNPHNQLDSAAAILGAFTPPFSAGKDRNQMIYLDSGKIGWADDTQSFAVSIVNNAYHTYELSVDAANVAHVTVDGVPALTRNAFVWNGTIAIGDQTNDPNVDSALRIRSVTKLCP